MSSCDHCQPDTNFQPAKLGWSGQLLFVMILPRRPSLTRTHLPPPYARFDASLVSSYSIYEFTWESACMDLVGTFPYRNSSQHRSSVGDPIAYYRPASLHKAPELHIEHPKRNFPS